MRCLAGCTGDRLRVGRLLFGLRCHLPFFPLPKMKKRVVAPSICVVLALMATACGGGGDSEPAPAPPPGTPAPAAPGPGPVPPPSGVANSVAQIRSDASGSHDAIPTGVTTVGPAAGQRIPPVGTVALGGYGELYTAPAHAATNTRVQLRNFETYALRRSTGKWTRIQFSERVNGAAYTMNYGGGGLAASVRNEATGGVSVKPVAGTVFRFWPESGLTGFAKSPLQPGYVSVSDMDAVFTTVQTRLVPDAAGGDDRAQARMVVSTAADWVSTPNLYDTAVPSALSIRAGTPLGIGKLRLVGNEWRAINFHSATATQVDALAEAQEAGGTAPIANSSRLDAPLAKRVILIGDSITEGSNSPAQDSFRRPLWNALVADASNPLVDFVGTRSGVTTSGGTCGSAPAATGGFPAAPDFDLAHEAYWGWCVNNVTSVLPGSLFTLANLDRPDVAVVHLGTNDILQGNQDPAAIRAELSTLVGQLRAANPAIRVLLAQVIPVSNAAENNQIVALNGQIAALAQSLNTTASPVTAVDQFTGFNAATDLYDGVHPTDGGEQKMAARWLPALKAAIQ